MRSFFLSVLATVPLLSYALNDPCYAEGVPGICVSTDDCSNGGGTSQPGFCLDDPENVQCCTEKCLMTGDCTFVNLCREVTGGYTTPGTDLAAKLLVPVSE